MSRRYLTLCTVCDWHTGLLNDTAAGDAAYKAHTCTAPTPPRQKKPKPDPAPAAAPPPPPPQVTVARPTPLLTLDEDRPVPTWNGVQLDDLDPDMPWQTAALCAQIEPELWFPEKGHGAHSAKAVCMRCPVRRPCLEEALRDSQTIGVFGGLTERERRKYRRNHDTPRSQSA